jgi:hypothetical protein
MEPGRVTPDGEGPVQWRTLSPILQTNNQEIERNNMLFGISGILGVLSILGMVYGYRLGGAIYILLAVAIVMLFAPQGRKSAHTLMSTAIKQKKQKRKEKDYYYEQQ